MSVHGQGFKPCNHHPETCSCRDYEPIKKRVDMKTMYHNAELLDAYVQLVVENHDSNLVRSSEQAALAANTTAELREEILRRMLSKELDAVELRFYKRD